ncbi:carbon-nitrogen hydrolase [Candidatus Fermentibacteria bacterium]|nr:carbon-nitrogen hydrolase [Candidatus Fermentibacteria bacterium]
MRVGLLQFAPEFLDPERTMERLKASFEEKLPGADLDLLVLPELSNSGYRFTSEEEYLSCAETLGDSSFIGFLAESARRYGLYIVAGMKEIDHGELYNTAVLVGADGLAGSYRKIHLFWDEKDYFRPGDSGLPVFDVGPARIGILICFDWAFPEVWRILALKGADVICHPSNLVLPKLCQQAVPVYSLVNHVYALTANRTGTERDLTFTGGSVIADPEGGIIERASADGERLLVSTIDLRLCRDKNVTPRNHLFDDRRVSEYGEILSES